MFPKAIGRNPRFGVRRMADGGQVEDDVAKADRLAYEAYSGHHTADPESSPTLPGEDATAKMDRLTYDTYQSSPVGGDGVGGIRRMADGGVAGWLRSKLMPSVTQRPSRIDREVDGPAPLPPAAPPQGTSVPGTQYKNMADGGEVTGRGGPTDDKEHIMVSPTEYVLPSDTTATIGVKRLDAIKDATHTPSGKPAFTGGVRRHADGGEVESGATRAGKKVGSAVGAAVDAAGNVARNYSAPGMLVNAGQALEKPLGNFVSGLRQGFTGDSSSPAPATPVTQNALERANADVMAGGRGNTKGFDRSALPNPANAEKPTQPPSSPPVTSPSPAPQSAPMVPPAMITPPGEAPVLNTKAPTDNVGSYGFQRGESWGDRADKIHGHNAAVQQAQLALQQHASELSGEEAQGQLNLQHAAETRQGQAAQGQLGIQRAAEERQGRSSSLDDQQKRFGIQGAERTDALQNKIATMPAGPEREAAVQSLRDLQGKERFAQGRNVKEYDRATGQIVGESPTIINTYTGATVNSPVAAPPPAAPAGHTAHLRENPALAGDYDAKYGAGAAAKILGTR